MQQHWTPDQKRQQISEILRNKGIICKDYLLGGRCPRSPTCPYMHIKDGETRPLPWSVCNFFSQGKCLRDPCTFFHGSSEQLEELRSSGAETYRPQDFMRVAEPPRDFLNSDGSIAVERAHLLSSIPSVPQFYSPPVPESGTTYAQMMLLQGGQHVSSPIVNAPIVPSVQYHYIPNGTIPAYQSTQSVNTYAPVHAAQTVPGYYANQGGHFYFHIQ